MAQIVTEVVTVKFSKIVKDANAPATTAMVTKEVLDAIEMMSEQLCGDAVVVEVTQSEAGA